MREENDPQRVTMGKNYMKFLQYEIKLCERPPQLGNKLQVDSNKGLFTISLISFHEWKP